MIDRACGYCGATDRVLQRDHIIPHSRGGGDDARNCLLACVQCNIAKHNRTPSEWRPQGLPVWIYQVEDALARKYKMAARKRPPIRPSDLSLPCDLCGFNLATDLDRGWVSWWQRYTREPLQIFEVVQFHVTCVGRQRCLGILDERYGKRNLDGRGLWCSDHHLSVFTGRHAIREMAELMWNYKWLPESDALRKMLEFFMLAAELPTTHHGDRCAEIRL